MIDWMNPLTSNGLGIALPRGCSADAILSGGRPAHNGTGSRSPGRRPFPAPRRQHRNDTAGGPQHKDQPLPLQVGEQAVAYRRGKVGELALVEGAAGGTETGKQASFFGGEHGGARRDESATGYRPGMQTAILSAQPTEGQGCS